MIKAEKTGLRNRPSYLFLTSDSDSKALTQVSERPFNY